MLGRLKAVERVLNLGLFLLATFPLFDKYDDVRTSWPGHELRQLEIKCMTCRTLDLAEQRPYMHDDSKRGVVDLCLGKDKWRQNISEVYLLQFSQPATTRVLICYGSKIIVLIQKMSQAADTI